jgi:pimeloyl-ACP methyl ester carboxylesterase
MVFSLLLFLMMVSCQPGKKATQRSTLPFSNSRFSIVDGVRLHYRTWSAEGDIRRGTVLLVHGFSGSTFSWERTAPVLQQAGFEVVAIDIPPFGYSDKSPRLNASVTARAVLLKQWQDSLFPGREWHLVGHSMGAGIVEAMALMYPEQTLSTVFVAGAVFGQVNAAEPQRQSLLRFKPVQTLMGNLAEAWFITPRRIGGLLESAYGSPPGREAIMAYYHPLQISGTARAILAGSVGSYDITDLKAQDLQGPLLGIWGENDTWVPLEGRHKVLDQMPGIKIEVIPGAGHNPMETHPDAFNKILLEFLAPLATLKTTY